MNDQVNRFGGTHEEDPGHRARDFAPDELRGLLHGAVAELTPSDGALERLRHAVPVRRARKRQAVIGAAAAVLLCGTAVPAAMRLTAAESTPGEHSAMAGHGTAAEGKPGGASDPHAAGAGEAPSPRSPRPTARAWARAAPAAPRSPGRRPRPPARAPARPPRAPRPAAARCCPPPPRGCPAAAKPSSGCARAPVPRRPTARSTAASGSPTSPPRAVRSRAPTPSPRPRRRARPPASPRSRSSRTPRAIRRPDCRTRRWRRPAWSSSRPWATRCASRGCPKPPVRAAARRIRAASPRRAAERRRRARRATRAAGRPSSRAPGRRRRVPGSRSRTPRRRARPSPRPPFPRRPAGDALPHGRHSAGRDAEAVAGAGRGTVAPSSGSSPASASRRVSTSRR